MDLRIIIGLAAVRLFAGFVFFMAAGLRTRVPGHFPVGRAIAASVVSAGAATAATANIAWLVHPAGLLAALAVHYRPTLCWRLGALALGLALEGAIRMGIAVSP